MAKSTNTFLVTLPYYDHSAAAAVVYQCTVTANDHNGACGLVSAIVRDRQAWLRLLGYGDASIESDARGESKLPVDNPAQGTARIENVRTVASRSPENDRLLAILGLLPSTDATVPPKTYPRPLQRVFWREVPGGRIRVREVVRNYPSTLKH
jgi:hypothetical protein